MSIEILIEPEELEYQLSHSKCTVVDATVDFPAPNFDGDYRPASGLLHWEESHIPSAHHVDLLHTLANLEAPYCFAYPSISKFQNVLMSLGVASHRTLVVYDKGNGFWAARLWWMLRSVGINARVLNGGWKAWLQYGGAIEKGTTYKKLAPSHSLDLKENLNFWCDKEEINKVRANPELGVIVCALSENVFKGQSFTRYTRRGHIPGSYNLPARSLLDDTGKYLTGIFLNQALGDWLYLRHTHLCLYCGGGISASSLALSLTLAGFTSLSIYDGSLQEWSAYPELPLETENKHEQ